MHDVSARRRAARRGRLALAGVEAPRQLISSSDWGNHNFLVHTVWPPPTKSGGNPTGHPPLRPPHLDDATWENVVRRRRLSRFEETEDAVEIGQGPYDFAFCGFEVTGRGALGRREGDEVCAVGVGVGSAQGEEKVLLELAKGDGVVDVVGDGHEALVDVDESRRRPDEAQLPA
mmetsp:Transcript_4466/g.11458  ORF Transcript_4466/g.11458 Transcript_4466/m.11458 type:complete len:174 (+) Transcript_4466:195-716(+)